MSERHRVSPPFPSARWLLISLTLMAVMLPDHADLPALQAQGIGTVSCQCLVARGAGAVIAHSATSTESAFKACRQTR